MQFSEATQNAVNRSQHQWLKASNNELVDFILERFHAVHRVQLPEAIALARRVEEVHANEALCPTGLAEHLTDMYQELESHMLKEEQILFPMLRANTHPQGPIMVMESEHEEHELAVQKIEELTQSFSMPEGACGTWRRLTALLIELADDLRDHIELENNVLFVNEEVRAGQCCGGCQ
ncbi:hemerythrin domain-containing protein [Aliidiomarina quisquiliarum]|uniref:hemerythrin domain-containing protein n=1 Tax=Aliidiomarina quisquiliarum TaxID=2938947 RepID=UPI00208FAACA|nr:hemerythrin domain-containing protein [Aliidiomarina quisquiliarum]MCO4322390.1 hemerythrin domain-containing protein [Aliidiomarina quisquiliarum]